MERQRVVSSNILSVGYDPDSQTLEMEFSKGSIYQYCGVPENIWHGLMQASSKGKYFHAHIRDRYQYRQVR